MVRNTWIVGCVIASSVAVSHVALAQDSKATDKTQAAQDSDVVDNSSSDATDDVTLKPINVYASKPVAAANNTTTIDKSKLDETAGNDVNKVLRETPGVFTLDNPGQAGVAVNIRGFEGQGRVTSMIDGVRQNFRFTTHEAGGLTYVDPNLLSGIDVTRGQVTTTGGGGLAGSVNFHTLDIDDILKPGSTTGVLGRLGWGSNGDGFSEMLSGATELDKYGLAAAISKHDSGNYKDGEGDEIENTGQDLKSGFMKFKADISDDAQLKLGAMLYNNKFTADNYGQTVQNNTFTGNYHYNPGNPLVDFKLNASYNELTNKWTSGTGSYVGRQMKDNGAGFDASNVSALDLMNTVQLRSENGVEYFHDDVSGREAGVNPSSGTSETGALFTENTFSYGIFDLVAGLRYNYYSLDGSASSTTTGDYSIDKSKGELDPKVTVAAQILDWLQPYATFSRSMRSPTVQETMLGGDHPGSTVSFLPNPDLDPETETGWEFGTNIQNDDLLTKGDKLNIRADYYVMDVDDYISSAFNTTYNRYQFVNVDGSTRVEGFEFSGRYDTDLGFVDTSYAHTHSNLPSQTPGLGASQYQPDDTASIGGGLHFLDNDLTVGARYTYISGGLAATTSGTAEQVDKSYGLIDSFASYKVMDGVTVDFKVANLLDKQYTPFLSTSTSYSPTYGPGRTFYISTQFQF